MSVSEQDEIDKSSAPLIEHLIELRRRLIWSIAGFFVAFLVCFFFAKKLFNLLVVPFKWATQWAGLDPHKVELIYTAPQEFFFTQVKLAMFGGMVIAFPLIATQIYKFIAPGLYKNERAAFLPFLIASPILFLMGAALVYFFFTPMVMWFFLAMQQAGTDSVVQISLLPKVSEYLSLIMTLIFSFGLVFQLPVVTSLMTRVGLLSSQALVDKRRWAIVIAFVVAAVLTPPDPLSQIGLALPTIILYEVAIITSRMIEKSQKREKLAREKEEATASAEFLTGALDERHLQRGHIKAVHAEHGFDGFGTNLHWQFAAACILPGWIVVKRLENLISDSHSFLRTRHNGGDLQEKRRNLVECNSRKHGDLADAAARHEAEHRKSGTGHHVSCDSIIRSVAG